LPMERLSDGAADAARRAGDQRRLPLQVEHVEALLS
jgi:hypothetical protein